MRPSPTRPLGRSTSSFRSGRSGRTWRASWRCPSSAGASSRGSRSRAPNRWGSGCRSRAALRASPGIGPCGLLDGRAVQQSGRGDQLGDDSRQVPGRRDAVARRGPGQSRGPQSQWGAHGLVEIVREGHAGFRFEKTGGHLDADVGIHAASRRRERAQPSLRSDPRCVREQMPQRGARQQLLSAGSSRSTAPSSTATRIANADRGLVTDARSKVRDWSPKVPTTPSPDTTAAAAFATGQSLMPSSALTIPTAPAPPR